MTNIFKYHKTSPEIIRLAVLMSVRFPLSLRNVEDLLHERGIDISYETVRAWWNKFGPVFASDIRKKRVAGYANYTHWKWHLDEVFVKINGELHYLWRAVNQEAEVLETYVTKRQNSQAALKFLRKIMKRHGPPQTIITDKLRSYKAAMRQLGNMNKQDTTKHHNNQAENSHQPFRRRERAMNKFRAQKSLQKFVSIHAQFHNHFNHERHLNRRDIFKKYRDSALAEWRQIAA